MTDIAKILVAGIGNIFFGDDGYGCAVAAAVARCLLPPGVRVVDYGVRGVHLAYDLLDGVDALVLIDAVPGTLAADADHAPGTVLTVRIGADDVGGAQFDAHSMSPASVLASLGALGGQLPPTWLIGCVPAQLADGIGLSEVVTAAVEPSVTAVRELVTQLVAEGVPTGAAAGKAGG